jgi:CBS domain-containing membrane protein
MQVAEVMSAEPVVVDLSTSLAECAARMVHLRVRHLPVVSLDGLVGLVTDAAVFQRGSFLGEADAQTPASRFVAYDAEDEQLTARDLAVACEHVCRPEDPVPPVIRALASGPQDWVVVVDERSHPVGIVTEHDVTRLAAAVVPPELVVEHLGNARLISFVAATPAGHVLDELMRAGIRHALITDPDGTLVGVVSQRDLLMDDAQERRDVPVDEVVRSRVLRSVPPGTSVRTCAAEMLEQGVGCLPVVQRGHAVGIVTRRDLVEAVATVLETESLFAGGS